MRDEHRAKLRDAPEGEDLELEEPSLPDDAASIRIWKYGTSIEVRGEDRTQVSGLLQRLTQAVTRRGATRPNVDRSWFVPAAVLLLSPLALAGTSLARLLGLASRNHAWEAGEIVGISVGCLLAIGLGAAGWWLFPPVELLDEGDAGRFRRFRVAVFGAIGALVLGVIASAVYAAIS